MDKISKIIFIVLVAMGGVIFISWITENKQRTQLEEDRSKLEEVSTNTEVTGMDMSSPKVDDEDPCNFSNSLAKNTKYDITISIENYTFEKKTDAWGILKDITFIIKNNQGSPVSCTIYLKVIDDDTGLKNAPSRGWRLLKKLNEGECIKTTTDSNLPVGNIQSEKELRLYVAVEDYSNPIVSVSLKEVVLE